MTSPLDDIRALIADLPGPSGAPEVGPSGLSGLAAWLTAWSAQPSPQVRRPILALYAGAPGPGQLQESEDKRARLEAVGAGTAAVCRLAAAMGAGLEAFDLAIDRPIGDVASGAALTERECAATMAFGMEVLAKQPDLLLIGHLGAAAIGEGLFRPGDGLERLRDHGGREVAACAGAILGARSQKVPVILDGEAAAAAAFALEGVRPGLTGHCRLAGPVSPRLLTALGMTPMLDLDDGEGAAGLACAGLVKLAAGLLER